MAWGYESTMTTSSSSVVQPRLTSMALARVIRAQDQAGSRHSLWGQMLLPPVLPHGGNCGEGTG